MILIVARQIQQRQNPKTIVDRTLNMIKLKLTKTGVFVGEPVEKHFSPRATGPPTRRDCVAVVVRGDQRASLSGQIFRNKRVRQTFIDHKTFGHNAFVHEHK